MLSRILEDRVNSHIQNNRLLLLQGPRRVGKLALLEKILSFDCRKKWFDLSEKKNRKELNEVHFDDFDALLQINDYVIINEAQYLGNLQQIIEAVLFSETNCSLVLLCSFEPELDEVLKEVLEQQELIISLLPLTFKEIASGKGVVEFDQTIDQRLLYGSYPEIMSIDGRDEKEAYLLHLVEEAIFTQLNVTERINKRDRLIKMLQAIAFEIGNPISYNDIAFKSGLDNETVERYIKLLVKSHILVLLPSYYNDNRYELKKTHCVYFIDNGIRNAVIRNFNELDIRNDVDQLWKNWLVSEKIKLNLMNNNRVEAYFWRTHTRQQIDYIEIKDGQVHGFKSIWDKRKKLKFPTMFTSYYPGSRTTTLNRATYWSFLK